MYGFAGIWFKILWFEYSWSILHSKSNLTRIRGCKADHIIPGLCLWLLKLSSKIHRYLVLMRIAMCQLQLHAGLPRTWNGSRPGMSWRTPKFSQVSFRTFLRIRLKPFASEVRTCHCSANESVWRMSSQMK
jgi:hypothetical protein